MEAGFDDPLAYPDTAAFTPDTATQQVRLIQEIVERVGESFRRICSGVQFLLCLILGRRGKKN
jgi:hypothetical protein